MKSISKFSVQLVKDNTALYDIPTKRIKSPDDAFKIFEEIFQLSSKPVEYLVMLCLNVKNEVVGAHTVHVGTINMSIIAPRDLFQRALLNNAKSIMIAHNHPSFDTTPSNEDLITTQRIAEAGIIMGIELLEHLIIGDNDYFSIRSNFEELFEQ